MVAERREKWVMVCSVCFGAVQNLITKLQKKMQICKRYGVKYQQLGMHQMVQQPLAQAYNP